MKILPENDRYHWPGPPFSARGILVSPDDCCIEDCYGFIGFNLKGFENRVPVAALRPLRKSIKNRFPFPESVGQVSPCDAGFQHVQNGVNEIAIAQLGTTPMRFR